MNNLDHITNLKQLLRVTIDDVKLVKGDNKYDFDAEVWHYPDISNKCVVCLAGSIMAKTLDMDIDVDGFPGYFDQRTESLLLLIEHLRNGSLIYIQSSLKTNDIEFNLNNLSELNLYTYDLLRGDMDEWERLYSDLK